MIICIYHGRNSNLVQFEILPVETPIGLSTSSGSKFEMDNRPVAFIAAECFEWNSPREIYSLADF